MALLATLIGSYAALRLNDNRQAQLAQRRAQELKDDQRFQMSVIKNSVLGHSEVMEALGAEGGSIWDERVSKMTTKPFYYATTVIWLFAAAGVNQLIVNLYLAMLIAAPILLITNFVARCVHTGMINAEFERNGWDVPRLMADLPADLAHRAKLEAELRRRATYGNPA